MVFAILLGSGLSMALFNCLFQADVFAFAHPFPIINASLLVALLRMAIMLGILLNFPKYNDNIKKYMFSDSELAALEPCMEAGLHRIVTVVNAANK
jgi:hypothetical protein